MAGFGDSLGAWLAPTTSPAASSPSMTALNTVAGSAKGLVAPTAPSPTIANPAYGSFPWYEAGQSAPSPTVANPNYATELTAYQQALGEYNNSQTSAASSQAATESQAEQAAAALAEKTSSDQAAQAVASGQLTIAQAQEKLAEQTAAQKAAAGQEILSLLTGGSGSGSPSLAALSSTAAPASSGGGSSAPYPYPVPSASGGSSSGTTASGSLDPTQLSPAEIAYETAAREQNGLTLQSGVKDDDALMAARGISGSGIQSAALRGLVAQSMGDSAATDRAIIQNRANVAEQEKLAEMGYSSQQSIAAGNNATTIQAANIAASNSRLNALLGVYGQFGTDMAGFGTQPVGGKVVAPPLPTGPAGLGGGFVTQPGAGSAGIPQPPAPVAPPTPPPAPPPPFSYPPNVSGGGSGGSSGAGSVDTGTAPAPAASTSPSMTALTAAASPTQNEGWGTAQQTPLQQGLGWPMLPASSLALSTLAQQRGTVY